MRMAGPDVVLFVVGALLFGSAAYALVAQGDDLGTPSSRIGVFSVAYEASEVEVGSESAGSMRSVTQAFTVNETNVGAIVVEIACGNDPAGAAAPFTLQVTVEGPNGLSSEPTSGTCGQGVTIEIPIADAPAPGVVSAGTETEARERVAPIDNATAAQGEWTVTVTGARSGGPVPLPVPAGDPAGTITLTASVWEPRFTAQQG